MNNVLHVGGDNICSNCPFEGASDDVDREYLRWRSGHPTYLNADLGDCDLTCGSNVDKPYFGVGDYPLLWTLLEDSDIGRALYGAVIMDGDSRIYGLLTQYLQSVR